MAGVSFSDKESARQHIQARRELRLQHAAIVEAHRFLTVPQLAELYGNPQSSDFTSTASLEGDDQ